MRAIIELICVVGAIGFAGYHLTPARVCFADRYSKVASCKTVDEVTTTLGGPPGSYRQSGGGYIYPHGISPNILGEIEQWVGDDSMILVRVNRWDGTVRHTWIVHSNDKFWWVSPVAISVAVGLSMFLVLRLVFPMSMVLPVPPDK